MRARLASAVFAGLMTFWLSSSAHAYPNDPGVNARQHEQQRRIAEGVRSGQLSPAEARRLQREQRMIRAEERRYKADGVLTRAERADLQRDLNRSSRHIYHEKHDAERRF